MQAAGTRGAAGGLNDRQRAVMTEAIDVLRREGATIVDPADIPSVVEADPAENLLSWGICSGPGDAKGRDEDCSVVFKYGMKRDFNAWLRVAGQRGAGEDADGAARVESCERRRRARCKYGQAQLDNSDEMDVVADRARYEADRAKDVRLTGANGIDAAMKQHTLDALLFPGPIGAALAARPGYPSVIVPFGLVPAPEAGFPAGFDAEAVAVRCHASPAPRAASRG